MSLSTLMTLILVWVAAIASPGPDVVQILRTGLKDRRAGVLVAIGIMLGNTLWISASLAGLSALIDAYPSILRTLQIIGGSYLSYLGFRAFQGGLRAWRSQKFTVAVPGASREPGQSFLSDAAALRLGLTTNLANPKAILFFGSVFAQFVRPAAHVSGDYIAAPVVALVLIVVGLCWFVGVALAVNTMATRLEKYSPIIDMVSGVVFLAVGLVMLYQGLSHVLGGLLAKQPARMALHWPA